MLKPVKALLAWVIILMPLNVAFAFETINDDILLHILIWVKPARKDVPNLSSVCKRWHRFTDHDLLWSLICEQEFGCAVRPIARNESERRKDFFERAIKTIATDVLNMKEWPREKIKQAFLSDDADKIEIALLNNLERVILQEVRALALDSPLKLESFFYAYYEMISDVVEGTNGVAEAMVNAIVCQNNYYLLASVLATKIALDVISNGSWSIAANGIRNSAHKNLDFFCRLGEGVRKQMLRAGYHTDAQASIRQGFDGQKKSLLALSDEEPNKIGLLCGKAVSLYWLAYLTRPDYITTYFIPAYTLASGFAQTAFSALSKKFPNDVLSKAHVMEGIADTTWQSDLAPNPYIKSLEVTMKSIADSF